MCHDGDEPPLLIFWSHESVWCGLWAAGDRFELRAMRGGELLRIQAFHGPADAYLASLEWLHSVELSSLVSPSST